MRKIISEDEIKQAAKEDYEKQRSWDAAFNREKGFIEGAKWVINKINEKWKRYIILNIFIPMMVWNKMALLQSIFIILLIMR